MPLSNPVYQLLWSLLKPASLCLLWRPPLPSCTITPRLLWFLHRASFSESCVIAAVCLLAFGSSLSCQRKADDSRTASRSRTLPALPPPIVPAGHGWPSHLSHGFLPRLDHLPIQILIPDSQDGYEILTRCFSTLSDIYVLLPGVKGRDRSDIPTSDYRLGAKPPRLAPTSR